MLHVNTVFQQRVTLAKVVDSGSTGGTATPSAWTLSGTGPTPLTGASGSAAVTAVPVAPAGMRCPSQRGRRHPPRLGPRVALDRHRHLELQRRHGHR